MRSPEILLKEPHTILVLIYSFAAVYIVNIELGGGCIANKSFSIRQRKVDGGVDHAKVVPNVKPHWEYTALTQRTSYAEPDIQRNNFIKEVLSLRLQCSLKPLLVLP